MNNDDEEEQDDFNCSGNERNMEDDDIHTEEITDSKYFSNGEGQVKANNQEEDEDED